MDMHTHMRACEDTHARDRPAASHSLQPPPPRRMPTHRHAHSNAFLCVDLGPSDRHLRASHPQGAGMARGRSPSARASEDIIPYPRGPDIIFPNSEFKPECARRSHNPPSPLHRQPIPVRASTARGLSEAGAPTHHPGAAAAGCLG